MIQQPEIVLLLDTVELGFLLYFIGLNAGVLLLNLVAIRSIRQHLAHHSPFSGSERSVYSGYFPPISVVVPAYNEEATICGTIHSMMNLNYPNFEVIVVNDGSKDRTAEVLIEEFGLQPFHEIHRSRISTKPLRNTYRSMRHPNLRFIDKENGGKADALNAGINASVNPLFCCVDADSFWKTRPPSAPEAPSGSPTAAPSTRGFWSRRGSRTTPWPWCRSSNTCAPSCSAAWAGLR
jgi:cellulose synthase/poly-beta-1,6-N-acetylglucosamine synthase-like glycosyltransferase